MTRNWQGEARGSSAPPVGFSCIKSRYEVTPQGPWRAWRAWRTDEPRRNRRETILIASHVLPSALIANR
jgi:uncharacterized protein YraI